jgi:hypothetical protein
VQLLTPLCRSATAAEGNEELYNFVTQVIGKVPGVRKTTTLLLPMVLKDVYQWHIPASACADNKE